jgi:hypothetical protein
MAAIQAMPTVAAHISGKAIAKAMEENLGWNNYKIVKDNAMIFEQAETQRLMNQVAEDVQTEAAIDPQAPVAEEGVDNGEQMM